MESATRRQLTLSLFLAARELTFAEIFQHERHGDAISGSVLRLAEILQVSVIEPQKELENNALENEQYWIKRGDECHGPLNGPSHSQIGDPQRIGSKILYITQLH